MRVINLNETGIKILNKKKQQMYITSDELPLFISGKYILDRVNNALNFNGKTLTLTVDEINYLPELLKYLKTEILKQV
jgi:predicted aspartyl protease